MKLENKERLLKLFKELEEEESKLRIINITEDSIKKKDKKKASVYIQLPGSGFVLNERTALYVLSEIRIDVTQKIKNIKNEIKFL